MTVHILTKPTYPMLTLTNLANPNPNPYQNQIIECRSGYEYER